ncbi:hypothetical protein BGZ60DRAFT_546209 [Tricladium varicosporioides]|nr:hypothetical protein BGZ60DRAFT_546209 [Hymenoscyphus varicosporioides]
MKFSSNFTLPEVPKIHDPDALSDNDLLWMPLRDLTRNLNTKVSGRAAFTVYLRWLEVHRVTPSKISAQWENTILHWVQSLRARGYLELDIINMVRHYQIDNNPQDIPNRRVPKREDIVKAYANYGNIIQNKSKDRKEDENVKPTSIRDMGDDIYWRRETKMDDIFQSSSSKNDFYASSSTRASMKKKIDPDEFLKPPPGNYICNRCGLRGHHLQACPTNMDPAFDKPPDNNYVCSVCEKRGKHYKSLCPLNEDPYCIMQRRKIAGIVTPSSDKALKTIRKTSGWARDEDSQREFDRMRRRDVDYGRLNSSPDSPSNLSLELISPSKRRSVSRNHLKRSLSDHKETSCPDRGYEERAKLPKTKTGANKEPLKNNRLLRAKEPKLMMTEIKNELEMPVNPVDELFPVEGFDNDPDDFLNNLHIRNPNGTMDTDEKLSSEDFNQDVDEPSAVPKPDEHSMMADSSDDIKADPSDDSNEVDVNQLVSTQLKRLAKEYTPFIQMLLKRRPEMKGIVNLVKRRPTAVDMWEEYNLTRQSKRKQVNVETLDSGSVSPPQSLGKTQVVAVMDGAGDAWHMGQGKLPQCTATIMSFSQIDGTYDDPLLERNKTLRHKNRFSDLGKEAVDKVKEITKDFPTFKFKRRSKTRRQSERTSSTSHTDKGHLAPSFQTEKEEGGLSEQSINISRSRVTSPPIKPTQHNLESFTPFTPLPQVFEPDVSTGDSGSSKSSSSPPMQDGKLRRDLSVYSARESQRSSLAVSRSTNEFRSTVRKIIEDSKAEEFQKFADSLQLPISSSREGSSAVRGILRRGETSTDMRARPNVSRLSSLQPETLGRRYRASAILTRKSVGDSRKLLPKKQALEDLKQFSQGLKLNTPVPADIAEILKIDSGDQPLQNNVENEILELKDTSLVFELPSELPEEVSQLSATSPPKELHRPVVKIQGGEFATSAHFL